MKWQTSISAPDIHGCKQELTLNQSSPIFLTTEEVIMMLLGWVKQGRHVDIGIFVLGVNSLSVSLYVRTFFSPGESSLLWQKNDRDLMGIMAVPLSLSLFLTWTDRSQIHNNRAYFNTFFVGTQGWLKINNLSIALRTLSFLVSLSFWVCFAVVSTLVVLHCSGGDFLSFLFFSFSCTPLFSGEAGMLSWVQSVIRHRAALSVSLYKQLWCLFLFSLVSMGKWLLERVLD